jgi:hypothetical protein
VDHDQPRHTDLDRDDLERDSTLVIAKKDEARVGIMHLGWRILFEEPAAMLDDVARALP